MKAFWSTDRMRRYRLSRVAAIALLFALPAMTVPAMAAAEAAGAMTGMAADSDTLAVATARIAEAAGRIAAAGKALEAASSDPDRIGALGKALKSYDEALSIMRGGVSEAAAREQEIGVDLSDRRAEISRLLAALEAMSRTPQPAQAMHPLGPVAAARAAAMMSGIAPAMQAQADKLADELSALQAARRLRTEGEASLRAGLVALASARAELSEAMRRAAPTDPGPDSPIATMLARDSATLGELAAALAESGGPSPEIAPAIETGPYAWPVDGRVLRRFNEPDAARVRHPGVVLTTSPFALVSAPVNSTVRYAGPFLEYGYVVVLEPDRETMIVLAGLAQLRVSAGASVTRGEVLGVLGGRALDVEEYVMIPESETGAGDGETLYIEVRRDQGPIDPEPLFAKDNG